MQEKLKGWFNEAELNKLLTADVKSCIHNCKRPNKNDIFNAFEELKPEDVKVLIIGQDPYPDEIKAHGLAFSYKNGEIPASDSLKNIFEKIKEDLQINNSCTNLSAWKKQGVLLLNTALTFTGKDNRDFHLKSWNEFINQVISKLLEIKTETKQPLIVMLWGKKANKLKPLSYKDKENEKAYQEKYPFVKILRSSHPSNNRQACIKAIINGEIPAFKNANFKPFKECNEFLGKDKEINWQTRNYKF